MGSWWAGLRRKDLSGVVFDTYIKKILFLKSSGIWTHGEEGTWDWILSIGTQLPG